MRNLEKKIEQLEAQIATFKTESAN
jgi:hypothetical protein